MDKDEEREEKKGKDLIDKEEEIIGRNIEVM